jgi:hypothetical protein
LSRPGSSPRRDLPIRRASWLNACMVRRHYGFYFFFPRPLAEGNG